MLSFVNPTTLESEISHGHMPILIAFLRNDHAFAEQISILKDFARLVGGQMKICLGDEYFLDTFFQQFGFSGTPFYLLISHGKEQHRYFGQASLDDLEELVRNYGMKR